MKGVGAGVGAEAGTGNGAGAEAGTGDGTGAETGASAGTEAEAEAEAAGADRPVAEPSPRAISLSVVPSARTSAEPSPPPPVSLITL